MQPRRSPARRRMRHPVRLVNARINQALIGEDVANAYRMGLRGAELLYQHFPDFYAATGLNDKPITPWLLLGCCAAFWQLVEAKGLELRWPGEAWGEGLTRYELAPTPAETLFLFNDVSAEWMSQLGYCIVVPRPVYFGYGVQGLLDQESDSFPHEPLTVLLWHLFGQTALGLGVPLMPMAANIDEDLAFDIFKIKQLPRSTPLQLLGQHLDIPAATAVGLRPIDLIAYAFGKTDNDLANYDEYEVEGIYMGEMDEEWRWGDLDHLIPLQCQARQLEETYATWSRALTSLRDLRAFAGQLHKACRAAERELQEPPKTLLTLLGYEEHHDHEVVI